MESMTINFAVEDICKTVNYYQKNFGFALQMAVDQEKGFDTEINESKKYLWAMLQSCNVSMMLQAKESLLEDVGFFFNTLGASVTFYCHVKNVEALYKTVQHNVTIFKPIETTWYGQKEFYVQDLNGYILCFSQSADSCQDRV